MKIDSRGHGILAAAILAAGCAGTTQAPASASLTVTVNVTDIANDGTLATLSITAKDALGNAGTGSVSLSAPYGDLNQTSSSTANVALASGSATATYACNASKDSRCVAGTVRISATWTGATGAVVVGITGAAPPQTGGGNDGGTTDGGTPPQPTSKIASSGLSSAVIVVTGASGSGLPTSTTATFHATDPAGASLASAAITFAEAQGEALVTLGATSATSDASGNVTVTITAKTTPGTAHVTASLGAQTATVAVLVLAGQPSIAESAVTPALLGLKGSGIQETGLMTFLVTDSLGTPIPGIDVTFTQGNPALVTLGRTTITTGADGTAAVDYTAKTDVGVSSIIATVVATGAKASHAIAVRGAKPSAAGFYFHCAKANLPVYTSVPMLETTTCEVRLSDRFGNRVGVPTPVYFATEAGAIDAVATTKAFDFANPNDPTEGTATVTFTSDMGNGMQPADVDPLVANPAQHPWPRAAEPSRVDGFLTRNPRDQLVTIIAMTQGEEAFVDSNHNGILDANEVFYDLGDPFIDANDDGVYDQIYTGGPWETRFCTDLSNCATYHPPNGQWDSQALIWVPTWVVFSGGTAASTAPAGQPRPANDYAPPCVDYGAASFADMFVYDSFFNTPAAGATYDAKLEGGSKTSAANLKLVKHGFGPELDAWGGMGVLGLDFDYRPVLPSGAECAAPASPTAPTACVMRLLFRDFDDGFRGTVEVDGLAPPTVGATGCPSTETFTTSVTVTGAHGTYATTLQSGTFAP